MGNGLVVNASVLGDIDSDSSIQGSLLRPLAANKTKARNA